MLFVVPELSPHYRNKYSEIQYDKVNYFDS